MEEDESVVDAHCILSQTSGTARYKKPMLDAKPGNRQGTSGRSLSRYVNAAHHSPQSVSSGGGKPLRIILFRWASLPGGQ
eukprot:5950692-Prymnesium_polylepis.2